MPWDSVKRKTQRPSTSCLSRVHIPDFEGEHNGRVNYKVPIIFLIFGRITAAESGIFALRATFSKNEPMISSPHNPILDCRRYKS